MSPRRRSGKRVPKPKEVSALAGDDDFWGQDAWGDDDDDGSFDEEALSDDGEDVVDSDFDEPEDAADDGAAPEPSARRAPRRRTGKYVDPALKRRGAGAVARPAKRAKTAEAAAPPPAAGDRASLRKSTKAASLRADAARAADDAARAERRAKARPPRAPDPPLTQEQLLAEAESTAVENEKDLLRLLRLEEERKRLPEKAVKEAGPRMVTRDKDGKTLVSFSEKDADARQALLPHCPPISADDGTSGGAAKDG